MSSSAYDKLSRCLLEFVWVFFMTDCGWLGTKMFSKVKRLLVMSCQMTNASCVDLTWSVENAVFFVSPVNVQ